MAGGCGIKARINAYEKPRLAVIAVSFDGAQMLEVPALCQAFSNHCDPNTRAND